jgi:hypothetical protein
MRQTLDVAVMRRTLEIVAGSYLGFEAQRVRQLVRILAHRHQDGYANAIRFSLVRPAAGGVDTWDAAHALFAGALHPRKFIPWLDQLAEEGVLSRADASTM